MTEREFDTKYITWIFANKEHFIKEYGNAGGIETKVTKGGTFNLKQWRKKQSHQPRSLKQASNSVGIVHKISDMSMGQKPFDITFCFRGTGLLVIWFDKHKEFFNIPIENVPATDSISYSYCIEHFTRNTLLATKQAKPLVF